MTQHIVNVPAVTIGKSELAEILGISVSTLEKRSTHELPPNIEGYTNRWYMPVVDRWLMERSQIADAPKKSLKGFEAYQ